MSGYKRRRNVYLLAAAAVLVVAVIGMALVVRHHYNTRTALLALQEANQADTVFKSDSAALSLVRHFDSPACLLGTRNDRMLAHYLLGRAHADMDDAPAAIQDYYDAIECADTTAKDCDFYLLNRIYGQMAYLLFKQGLYANSLLICDKAIHFAWKARDNRNAIVALCFKSNAYEKLGKDDSVLIVSKQAHDLFLRYGFREDAAKALSGIFEWQIKHGNFSDAYKLIKVYEKESGKFDSSGNVKPGYEIHYYLKGKCFLGLQKYDSAEYYFRKELNSGKDFNNQDAASYGLTELYRIKGNPDSVAKYAVISRTMNDSAWNKKAITESQRIQSLYDYSHQQRIAEEKSKQVDRKNKLIGFLLLTLLFISILSVIVVRNERLKRLRAIKESEQLLVNAQSDLLRLASARDNLSDLVKEKERIIIEHHKKLEEMTYKAHKKDVENIVTSACYMRFNSLALCGKQPTNDDWEQFYILVNRFIPDFYSTLYERHPLMTENDYRICFLTKLHFKPGDIANLIGASKQYVTNRRRELTKILFPDIVGEKVHASDFDNAIEKI